MARTLRFAPAAILRTTGAGIFQRAQTQVMMSFNVVAENTNVLGRNRGMSGSLSMVAAVFWNEQGEIYEMKAGYSEDGIEFFELPLPEFAPFGANPLTFTSVENLGDILFNANGDYTGENYFRLKGLAVYLPTGEVENGYAGWRSEQEFATVEDGEPMADPDGDGLVNLVEYALGLNPLAADRAGLPAGVVESVGDFNYLTLNVAKNPDASDVALIVEVSDDLINWNSGIWCARDRSRVCAPAPVLRGTPM